MKNHGGGGSVVLEMLFQRKLDNDSISAMNLASPLAALFDAGALPHEFHLFDFILPGVSVASWNKRMLQCKSNPIEAEKIGKNAICEWVSKQWSDIEKYEWVDKVGFSESSLGKIGFRYVQSMLVVSLEAMIWANDDVDCAKVLIKDKAGLVGFSRCLGSMNNSLNLAGFNKGFFKGVQAEFDSFLKKNRGNHDC